MDNMQNLLSSLIGKVEKILEEPSEKEDKLHAICTVLKERVPHYDRVGFYLVDRASQRELLLGPYAGEPTEHTRVPFGRGICGQAAERKMTFLVQDVSQETNYLSCSPKVQSEIVVPIFQNGELVGELDIDSHARSPFTEQDREFLEEVCVIIADLF